MKQVVQYLNSGDIEILDVPVPVLQKGGVIVRTAYSVISIGTELMKVKTGKMSLLQKAKSRPDQVKKVIETVKQQGLIATYRKVKNRLEAPSPLGYSIAGEVVEVADDVTEFSVGDLLACGGAEYAFHAEYNFVPRNLCAKIPDGLTLEQAAFSTVGAIAMQGLRQAEVVLGECVLVIGLGLLGQILLQIIRACGAQPIGIDVDPKKVDFARSLGFDHVWNREDDVKDRIMAASKGIGVDSVIVTAATESNDPTELGIAVLRDRGRFVDIGIIKMDIPWRVAYPKELEFRMSRSYGPGRYDPTYEEKGVDYPIGYVRWTEKRNMESFLNLIAQKRIDVASLVTHRFPFSQASETYKKINEASGNENYIGVVFEYEKSPIERTVTLREPVKKTTPPQMLTLGVIGAGNYVKTMLLPHIQNMEKITLAAIATATGTSAVYTGEKFGFETATTEPAKVLDDEKINALLIGTRHNLHSSFIIRGLKNNKHVFCEKPMALNKDELHDIIKAHNESKGSVMIGYNRRFAPLMEKLKFSLNPQIPMVMSYIVNAGFMAKDSWYQDPEQGGGRIIGEVCHFVDVFQYLTDDYVQEVFAKCVSDTRADQTEQDNVIISLKTSRGSVGEIIYTAYGDRQYPKERIQVFNGGTTCFLDNFKSLKIYKGGKCKKIGGGMTPDKGQRNELIRWVETVLSAGSTPIPFQQLLNTSLTTIAVIESLKKSAPVELHELNA